MSRRNTSRILGRKSGFTLLELSVVLTLIGLIVSGGLAVMTSYLQASQYNVTVARMDTIESALLKFATTNTRIPCPSDLTQTSSSTTYGLEAGAGSGSAIGVATGVCTGTGMLRQANFAAASGTAEGGVPTRTLQLPDDYMYDGWGRRFRYAADPSMTVTGALPVQTGACAATSSSAITVNDSTGAARTTAAIYALVSHGANGHGAYTTNGVTVNASSTSANELTNCHCTSAGVYSGTYTPTYVEKAPAYDAGHTGNALYYFDDIVTFKEGWQMQAQNFTLGAMAPCVYIASYSDSRVRKVNGSGIITTVAGNGTAGYSGDGAAATAAELYNPHGVAVDSVGNIYVVDYNNNRIRKVNNSGTITTVAGNGTAGYSGDNGPATSAELSGPFSVALDSTGNLYIADYVNSRIRMVNTSGTITTVAGNGTAGFAGDGAAATSAELNHPFSIRVDIAGNLYIADSSNYRIRKVNTSGTITTVAGNGTAGFGGDNGPATSAEFNIASDVALDSAGNLYIADALNNRVRMVNSSGIITTVAGNGTGGFAGDGTAATSAELYVPFGIVVDSSGNLYIADDTNQRVRKVNSSGTITTVAGNGTGGSSGDNGAATGAELSGPVGVALGVR